MKTKNEWMFLNFPALVKIYFCSRQTSITEMQ